MNIAIIGAGNVGSTLGKKLAAKGHKIIFGVRQENGSKHAALEKLSNISIKSPAQAVKESDIVLLATPWSSTKEAVESCGNLEGKTIIDCTNPIKKDFSDLEVGHSTSGAEIIAGWIPKAHVVKSFNQTGFENMEEPELNGQRAVMFVAGDNELSVAKAANVVSDVGFEAVTLKGLHMARQLEQLAWLWINAAIKQGKGRNCAFYFIKR